ncbi:MAG: fatty acid--CoA ligase [Conexivisphaerales archaeon]
MENYNYQLNLKNLFSNTKTLFGSKEIVYRDIKRYTYSEFLDRVNGLCIGLQEIGVKKGDTIGVLDWDTTTYMESYFAIPMSGAVMHTVNIRYPPELIYLTMNHAGDKYVIVRDEFIPVLEKSAPLFDFIKGWITYSDITKNVQTSLSPHYDYEELVKRTNCEPPDIDENSQATVFYTSGTTGMPKGVTFTHRNLFLHTLSLVAFMKYPPLSLTASDAFMSLVPMFHVHSWGMPYVALLNGNKYVLPGKYEPAMMLYLLKNEKVTFSTMVPSILYMILNTPNIEDFRDYLNGWKVIIGGAALPKGLAEKARKLGIITIGGYGLSETCPVLTIAVKNDLAMGLSEEEAMEYLTSAGLPVPMANVKVVDSSGKEVPQDSSTVGEVVARAPWLTSGYYLDPEKSKELWKGGWLHTGDLAIIDKLGYIHIVDREKDAVKSGGEFIPTLIVENVLSEIYGVNEVAVVGVPDEKWGERPVAFITKKGDVSEREIYDHLGKYVQIGRIQKWWIPDKIIFIESMPRTSTNKVDKKELRRTFTGS